MHFLSKGFIILFLTAQTVSDLEDDQTCNQFQDRIDIAKKSALNKAKAGFQAVDFIGASMGGWAQQDQKRWDEYIFTLANMLLGPYTKNTYKNITSGT